MPKAKLLINGEKETGIESGVTTIGRTTDNTISLVDDSNVSRYHAEIEKRGDEYWLIELGSSNGTTVNGVDLYSERLLRNGDTIVLGGSSQIVFELVEENVQQPADESFAAASTTGESAAVVSPAVPEMQAGSLPTGEVGAASEAAIADEAVKSSKLPLMLGIVAVVCGLAVVFAVAAIAISFSGGKDGKSGSGSSNCQATAKITSPESGDLVTKETEVEIDAENADCVKRAIFSIDGVEFASATDAPYKVALDPKEFPEYSDGFNHSLKVAFEDEDGNKSVQPDEVLLSFETLATPTPVPEATETPAEITPTTKKTPETKVVTNKDTPALVKELLADFPGSPAYKFDDQFMQAVQKKTADYVSAEGFSARAQNYRDTINVPFQETGLGVAIGYLSAMSRSGFKPLSGGAEKGLWGMTDEIVAAKGYNGLCGAETLTDPQQKCAARAAALYLKDLSAYFTNGEGGIVYVMAAFGMSPENASQWKSTLPPPPARADFWKVIANQKQRDEVVKFFAAGIVAKNPQKFGLKKDSPISEIYKNFIGGK